MKIGTRELGGGLWLARLVADDGTDLGIEALIGICETSAEASQVFAEMLGGRVGEPCAKPSEPCPAPNVPSPATLQ